eukprot:CCRYP_011330-RA/>CCRYP_011330-RA protein AED:0.54 eAED:0.38 QI:0/0/0/0.5/0/0/2/0/273
MAPKNLQAQQFIHQRHTRINSPMQTIFEESAQGIRRTRQQKTTQSTPPPPPRRSIAQYQRKHAATTTPSPSPVPNYITQDENDCANISKLTTPTFHHTPHPCNLPSKAQYHVLGTHLENNFILSFTPDKLRTQQHIFQSDIQLDHHCNGVVHPVTNKTITKYERLANDPLLQDVWTTAMCKELGQFAQGWGENKGTDTVFFLSQHEIKQIPKDRTVTYAHIVVDYRPQKDDPNRVRITVGGNFIEYPGELTTLTADLTKAKILWNSTISTPGA